MGREVSMISSVSQVMFDSVEKRVSTTFERLKVGTNLVVVKRQWHSGVNGLYITQKKVMVTCRPCTLIRCCLVRPSMLISSSSRSSSIMCNVGK